MEYMVYTRTTLIGIQNVYLLYKHIQTYVVDQRTFPIKHITNFNNKMVHLCEQIMMFL